MNATSVKAELKAWEHAFLAKHGHTATREDIKADPIAEKYKLYKKLMKEADSNEQTNGVPQERRQVEPPRTPPRPPRASSSRQRDATAAIIPKSRPTTSSVSATTTNPFSPVKKKQSHGSTSLNPFITPVKLKQRKKRTPSPDLFTSSFRHPPTAPVPDPNPGLSKARKRLRGESVSPSPQPRDKRPRAGSLAVAAEIPKPVMEEGDSFVDDSPVKAPVPGKSFKPLFEETLPLSQPVPSNGGDTIRGRAFARSKTMPGGLFGSKRKDGGDDRGTCAVRGVAVPLPNGKGEGREASSLLNEPNKSKKRVLPGPKGLIPGKDDLFGDGATPIPPPSGTRKRNLSKVADGEEDEAHVPDGWHLLPPSPPPQNENGRYNFKGKGKALRKGKKAKRASDAQNEGGEEDGASSDGVDVKIVALHARPSSPGHDDELALEIDPEFHSHLRNRAIDGGRARSASPQLSRFDVDLPEEMQRMLALSPKDANREKEEEYVVKSLIRGRRRGIAEVWGAGEFAGESEGVDDIAEDDWEGEGVPWEVAEL
ncbi:hypothetical protein BU17DRAFT_50765 [Hysterangium stoloniferum]|nr:hypothetical protein BU17DRAFT_50765 [Hysterangium stoloniferum]